MTWYTFDNKQKIMEIIKQLISDREEIKVQIEGNSSIFTSKLIKINHEDSPIGIGKEVNLITEKLSPEEGNSLIQSAPHLMVEFQVNQTSCKCSVDFIGIGGYTSNTDKIYYTPARCLIDLKFCY